MKTLGIISQLSHLKNPQKAKDSLWFFKTGRGEYGDGDVFWGLTVPQQRTIAKKFANLPLNELQKLLSSKVHEHRQTALFILVLQYKKANETDKKRVVDFYLKNTKNVNNWDLVDCSAPYILGNYLLRHAEIFSASPTNTGKRKEILKQVQDDISPVQDSGGKQILYQLAKSRNVWERRIAVLSTFAFIKESQFEDSIKISEMLLNDKHDLIHKAVGWMLREVGKKDKKTLTDFLNKYSPQMPRTMLRYAIEKLDEEEREKYLKKRPNYFNSHATAFNLK